MSDAVEKTLASSLAECGVALNDDELKAVAKDLRSSWGRSQAAKEAAAKKQDPAPEKTYQKQESKPKPKPAAAKAEGGKN